jgi:ApaG protein
MNTTYQVDVSVVSEFLPDQSDGDAKRWVFAYHVTIANHGQQTARLLTRHWVITDGEERVQEVHGEGVIGQQPSIAPGQSFSYSSGAILETVVGSMYGSYQMLSEDGTCFDADIPAFTLAAPHALH